MPTLIKWCLPKTNNLDELEMRVINLKNLLKMKRLKKLAINPEKVIKNEELKNLKGGGYGTLCCLDGGWDPLGPCFYGVLCGNPGSDRDFCNSFYPGTQITICHGG